MDHCLADVVILPAVIHQLHFEFGGSLGDFVRVYFRRGIGYQTPVNKRLASGIRRSQGHTPACRRAFLTHGKMRAGVRIVVVIRPKQDGECVQRIGGGTVVF